MKRIKNARSINPTFTFVSYFLHIPATLVNNFFLLMKHAFCTDYQTQCAYTKLSVVAGSAASGPWCDFLFICNVQKAHNGHFLHWTGTFQSDTPPRLVSATIPFYLRHTKMTMTSQCNRLVFYLNIFYRVWWTSFIISANLNRWTFMSTQILWIHGP